MNLPKVFIIILNYNGLDCIKTTLVSVLRLDYLNFEIVLVDNNSQDGSFELVRREFPKVTSIKNSENLGFSAGNNIGIEYALERGADYIFLLNYDTKVEKSSLSYLVEEMEKDKKTGIASPMIFEGDTSNVWFSGGKIDWLKMKSEQIKNKKTKNYYNSDYLSGCAMLIRAEVFRKIGLFDEKFFLYWEDTDFSVRAKKAGYKLAVYPQSRICHFEKSQEKMERKIYWLVLSGLIFFKKNYSFFYRPWFSFYVLLRKIKNRHDIKKEKTAINEAVQKAYQDFKHVE
jgi:GT2 family glycosyltransferase